MEPLHYITRQTLANALSLVMSCVCYSYNDPMTRGRSDQVYQKLIANYSKSDDDQFVELLSYNLNEWVTKVTAPEMPGPGPMVMSQQRVAEVDKTRPSSNGARPAAAAAAAAADAAAAAGSAGGGGEGSNSSDEERGGGDDKDGGPQRRRCGAAASATAALNGGGAVAAPPTSAARLCHPRAPHRYPGLARVWPGPTDFESGMPNGTAALCAEQ